MTTSTQGEHAQTALQPIQRFEVVDCIDSKHVPAVIPNASGPWVRYEDHAAQVAALTAAQEMPKCEFLAHGCDTPSYCQSVQRCTARDEKRAPPAQPAALQGVAYAGPSEFPAGAIVNGRTHIDRLESFYRFDCEAGPLINCDDWHGLKRCFEHLVERASNGQAPAGAYKDSTPGLHVGDSSFESWYADYVKEGTKGLKQHCRDAYAAGMGDPLVTYAPTAQAAPAAGAVVGWQMVPLEPTVDQEWEGKDASRRVDSMAEACKIYKAMLAAAPTPAAQADSVLEDAARLWDAFVEAWRHELGVDKIVNIMGGADKLKAVFVDSARKQGGKHD